MLFRSNSEYIMEEIEIFKTKNPENFQISGSVINVIVRFLNGLRSSCTYSNSASIDEYKMKAVPGIQTYSGYWEGKPHAFLK